MQQEVSWYFVDLFGQRQGPISRQQLLDAIASERLRPASLVWREGMAQWQPLSSMMHELQAANPAVPPPILPPARVDTNPFAASPSSFASNEWGAQAQRRVVYGGFARRLLASILDSIILSIFNVIVLAVLGAVFVPSFKQGNAAAGGIIVFAYLGLFVISILYFCLQESSAAQATLGKRALGIKVTDLQGNRIGFGRALGRWFGRILSSLFFCIGYLMVIFTERKQGLHDMMTSTLVVDKWAYTDHPERQQQGTSGAVIAISVLCVCLLVIVPILAAIAIPQYQKYVTRSQATAAYYSAVALKPAVVEAYNNMGRCPANGEAGIRNASDYAEKNVSAIDTGAFEGQNDTCAIQVTIKSTSHQIDGKHIWLSTTPSQGSQWTCSTDLPASEAPMQCR